jgi:hypothetical protein
MDPVGPVRQRATAAAAAAAMSHSSQALHREDMDHNLAFTESTVLLIPGVPMMSVRDALYDVMFDPGNAYGVKREEILVDIVHVGD